MSRYTHVNVPQGPVIDRRIFVAIAGVAAAAFGFVGVRGCVDAKKAGSIEIYVPEVVSGDRANELADQLTGVFRNVKQTTFVDAEMGYDKWVSATNGGRSWLAFGSVEQDTNILLDLDCHDWADQIGDYQDSLVFVPGDASLRSLPLEGNVGLLLCNKALFDSIGVGMPSVLDDLIDIVAILAESGIEPFALEHVDVDSTSLNLALDSSLVYWADCQHPEPESMDRAIAVLAASILRCGRREDGTSLAGSREDALLAFKEGKAAMVLASSGEICALTDIAFTCFALPIPTPSADAPLVFRPTRSLVCSSRLPEDACSSVLDYLHQGSGNGFSGSIGSVVSFRNEEGGLTIQGLPESMTPIVGPATLFDDGSLGESMRRSYRERIVAFWNQDEVAPITYVDEEVVDI